MQNMEKTFKVIICGSRHFKDYELLESKVNNILKFVPDEVEIVCGMYDGADLLGKRYGEEHGFKVLEYPPDWSLGASAGPRRNSQMVAVADAVIAFTSGGSGTTDCINKAKRKGLKVRVINISTNE